MENVQPTEFHHEDDITKQVTGQVSVGAIACKQLGNILKTSTLRVYIFDVEEMRWYRVKDTLKGMPDFVNVCIETRPGFHKWKLYPWHIRFYLWLGEQ